MNQFPSWYQSTVGPQISGTLIGIAGNVIPVLNLVLASKGVNLLPEAINPYITIAVFVFFSVKAAIGYVKAKRTLGARIVSLGGSL